MSQLDKEWALHEIDEFLQATAWLNPPPSNVVTTGSRQRASDQELAEQAVVLEKILAKVVPQRGPAGPLSASPSFRWNELRRRAVDARVLLVREEELRKRLGDDAPEMDAGRLHPWVWESAASYWRTGHHSQAVQQAAIRINAEAQAKAGRRDVSEVDLFNQLFTLEPPKPGAPRLRLMVNDGSKTYENLHRGARALADGLYTAIRNPGAHSISAGDDEQLAMEQLAAWSLLARWVDQAQLVTN